jgi:hypothetical protein
VASHCSSINSQGIAKRLILADEKISGSPEDPPVLNCAKPRALSALIRSMLAQMSALASPG